MAPLPVKGRVGPGSGGSARPGSTLAVGYAPRKGALGSGSGAQPGLAPPWRSCAPAAGAVGPFVRAESPIPGWAPPASVARTELRDEKQNV